MLAQIGWRTGSKMARSPLVEWLDLFCLALRSARRPTLRWRPRPATPSCARLCRRREEALSPTAIEEKHDSVDALPRSGRTSHPSAAARSREAQRRWFRGVIAAGLTEEQYVDDGPNAMR